MRPGSRTAVALALLGPVAASGAIAQQASGLPTAAASQGPHISLITIGPGPVIWELFGHNMIRVMDPAAGIDVAYDWGRFDFGQRNFFWNFLQGRMRYWMARNDPIRTIAYYESVGRSIRIQDLSLTPDQARALAERLDRNAEPDQMFYRYDYYRDNCSTRVRDALDGALDGALERDLTHFPSHSTYRSQTAALTSGRPLWFFGLMLMLGPGADERLDAWQESFIPMELARHLVSVTILDPDGTEAPLVIRSDSIPARSGVVGASRAPEFWTRWFLLGGVVVGGALAWTGWRSGGGKSRGPFVTLAGIWSLLSGLAGFAMVYLWAFTDHTVAYRNENLLQSSVLGLALFGLLAASARGRDTARGVCVMSAAILVASILGLILKVFPGPQQVNGVVLAFFIPANLGMALGAMRAVQSSARTLGPT